MNCVVVCNSGSDSLSKVNIKNMEVKTLKLSTQGNLYGPHELTKYKGKILTANNYNNSISVIDVRNFNEEKSIYIGAHPNDIRIYKDKGYVLCGDSNSIIVYDLINDKIQYQINTGIYPHSIALVNDTAFVANMYEDTIGIIDCIENTYVDSIKVGNNPGKIKISNDKKYLYICISNLECDNKGYISIIDAKLFKVICTIDVGFMPIDLYEYETYLYVSNLCSGYISIINLNTFKEENIIICNGMPRGLVRYEENLFVCDYLNNVIKIIDKKHNIIKAIAVGKEPSAMTFINDSTDKL